MTIFGQARHPFTHAVHGEKLSRKFPIYGEKLYRKPPRNRYFEQISPTNYGGEPP